MPTARVGDIDMYYEVHGEGRPLLMIPGLGADLTSWAFQVPEFSRRFRVITFDNRGAGRTDAPDEPYSLETMADDAAGLLDCLGIDRAHVLGLSMGGMIAQELAIKHPARVHALVLATTAAGPYPWATHVLRATLRLAEEGASQEALTQLRVSWLFTDRFFENPDLVQLAVDTMLANPHRQPVYAYARQFAAARQHDARERLGRIAAPTLVLVGRQDILLPVRLSEELAAGIPGAELVVLEGGGHGFLVEVADDFNRAVLEFLDRFA
ncbi:MAG: alpha/beta fold hydrolase [Chloroflexota bacterium]|nr:alpha/beta fold hydrolase [Chloroflexota bacterium]